MSPRGEIATPVGRINCALLALSIRLDRTQAITNSSTAVTISLPPSSDGPFGTRLPIGLWRGVRILPVGLLPVGQIASMELRLIRSHVKPFREKYFTSVLRKYVIVSAHPASIGGAYRDRHGRGKRDAMDARMLSARDARRRKHCSRTSEVVRSRRPDAGVNLRVTSPGGWWLTSPVHQGDHV